MRAVRCHAHGDPGAVVVEHVSEPAAGAGEALIDVAAASVNYPDALIVRGEYQLAVPPPFTPGSDFAGTVAACGPGVDTVRPGDRVCGTVLVGAFAERVVAPAPMLQRIPDGVGFVPAAAFPVVYATAYEALVTVGEVQPGDDVLVLGAAGGVGSAAVELAKALGARVIAAASSPAKLAAARERGADAVIDYAREDLKLRAKALSGDGVDVVIDPVGGPYAEPALRAMAVGGRYVVVGFASREIPRIPLNLVLLKGVEIRAYEAGKAYLRDAERTRRHRDELLAMLATGRIRPLVSERFALADAGRALAAVYERRAIGKLVVEPGR